MSGRKRSGKKAWDDLIDATSSKDGDPFEMLRGDLNEEQRELFKKLREREGDFVAGLSESDNEMDASEVTLENPESLSGPPSPLYGRGGGGGGGRVAKMLARSITANSAGGNAVSTASQADITAAYLNGELTFSEYSSLMDNRQSTLDQSRGEDDSFVDEGTDADESETMSQTTSNGQSRTTDFSEWETADDEDEYGDGYEPPRKRRKPARRLHQRLDKALQGLMGEANMSFAKGQHDNAIKTCMEVIRLAPNAPEPFRTLGMIHEEKGEVGKCLQFSLIAAHLNPGDPEEWAKLAEMSLELDDPKQALICFSKALRSDPGNISLHMKKCRLLERVGEKKKSLDGYQAVLKLLPETDGEKYMQMARDLAKGYHDLGSLDRAEETLCIAFVAHVDLVSSEDINMLTEIQIHLKEYEKVLKTLVKYCGVDVLSEGGERVEFREDDDVDPASIEMCLVPDDLPIDLRVKLAICLIFLESSAPPFAIVEKILDESPEEMGDLYLDLADAFSEMGKYEVANVFLEKLVHSVKYNLAAVWLRYAESLNAVGKLDESVEAYRSVVDLAPSHREARMAMSSALQQLGRSEEALDVLGIDSVPPSITEGEAKLGDMRLLLQRCLLLYSQKKFDDFFSAANQLLFAHFKDVFSPSHLATILSNRSLRHRTEALRLLHGNRLAQRILAAPKLVAVDSGVTVNDLWDVYLKVCYTLMDQKDYRQLESFTIAALMTPNFMKETTKAKEAEFICLIACILNKNGHFAYNFIKEICVKDVNNFRAWNLFCQIITISQDLRHNRFCLRLMFKRPDHLPLGILNGHNSLVAGSYKHSLGEYVAALKQSPDDPLLNLLIGVTFIHMASQKFATKRHSLVVQSF